MEDSPRVKSYNRLHRVLAVAGLLLDLSVLLAFLFTGWTRTIRTWSWHISGRPAIALLVCLLVLGSMTWVIGLPLDIIKSFWLERRFGLSNLSFAGWLKDEAKGLALGGSLGVLGFEFLYWSIRRWPETWWVISGGAFVGFSILLAILAPVLILPVFFKFKPLKNASLAERLLALAQRAGTNVKGVFEWKLSEKSRKANAALVGLGKTRRIVISDTLLEQFKEDEAEAVLAHEFGHHVHHHILQRIGVQVAGTFLGFYLANVVLVRLDRFFGFEGLADFANLPLLILTGTALSLLLLPAVNAHSRAMERQADGYALRAIPSKAAFISSMEKLARLNLAERRTHPWIELIFHSHPSIEKRIRFAEKFQAD